jgi:hypothetical protein
MAKTSAAHQAAIDVKNAAQREVLAYHHILRSMASGSGKWGTLQRVGSAYETGSTWVWLLAFTPRMRDAVIMETFKSGNGDETVRCFFLADIANTYRNRSLASTDLSGEIQQLYFRAAEMELIEQNRAA